MFTYLLLYIPILYHFADPVMSPKALLFFLAAARGWPFFPGPSNARVRGQPAQLSTPMRWVDDRLGVCAMSRMTKLHSVPKRTASAGLRKSGTMLDHEEGR